MSAPDDRNEGVSPLFGQVLGALLDAPLPMQTRHLAQRGKRVAKCGSYEGQTTKHRAEVTCDACKVSA